MKIESSEIQYVYLLIGWSTKDDGNKLKLLQIYPTLEWAQARKMQIEDDPSIHHRCEIIQWPMIHPSPAVRMGDPSGHPVRIYVSVEDV